MNAKRGFVLEDEMDYSREAVCRMQAVRTARKGEICRGSGGGNDTENVAMIPGVIYNGHDC